VRLHEVGHDPDPRFTLANERTFLAWLRTGLALVAAAVALAGLLPDLRPAALRIGVTVLLLALAVVVTAGAYVRWYRAERALREDRSLLATGLPRVVAAGLVVVVLGAGALVLLGEL
jgi:putative membrane protein